MRETRVRVLSVLALMAVALCGTSCLEDPEVKALVKRLLKPERWQDVTFLAIEQSQDSLAALGDPDAAFLLSSQDLEMLADALTAELGADKELTDDGIQVRRVRNVATRQQALVATIVADVASGTTRASLEVEIGLAIGSEGAVVFYDPYILDLKIRDLELGDRDYGALEPLANAILGILKSRVSVLVRSLLETTYAEEFNNSTTFALTELIKIDGVKDELEYYAIPRSIALLATKKGLYGILTLENLEDPPPTVEPTPRVPSYERVSRDQVDAIFETYEKEFLGRVPGVLGKDTHAGKTVLGVRSAYVSQTLNGLANRRVLRKHVDIRGDRETFEEEIALELEPLLCAENREACTHKDVCEAESCSKWVTEKWTETIGTVCKYDCCLKTGFIGCIIKDICEKPCNKVVEKSRQVLKPIESPACDAFRAYLVSQPGGCDIAKELAKAECDIRETIEKIGCDFQESIVEIIAKNPVGDVYGDYLVHGGMEATLLELHAESDLGAISGRLALKGAVSVEGKVTVAPRTGDFPCEIGYRNDFDTDLSTDIPELAVTFERRGVTATPEGGLKVKYEMPADVDVEVTLEESPLDILLPRIGNARLGCDGPLDYNLSLLRLSALAPVLEGIAKLTEDLTFSQGVREDFDVEIEPYEFGVGDRVLMLEALRWDSTALVFSRSGPARFVVDFKAKPIRGTDPLPVEFSNESAPIYRSWQWDFGDGARSTERDPRHIYESPGEYVVTLEATGKKHRKTSVRAKGSKSRGLTVIPRLEASVGWENIFWNKGFEVCGKAFEVNVEIPYGELQRAQLLVARCIGDDFQKPGGKGASWERGDGQPGASLDETARSLTWTGRYPIVNSNYGKDYTDFCANYHGMPYHELRVWYTNQQGEQATETIRVDEEGAVIEACEAR